MKIFKELIELSGAVVGLGFFDGVHIGHQELIKHVITTARQNNLPSVLVTFQKSPAEKFVDTVQYLTTNEEKENILAKLEIDYLFELDFNDALMNMCADDYLEKILVKYLHPKFIFTGFNHTFGKGKSGTPEFLKENEKEYGYTYIQIPPVKHDGVVVSSTKIKQALNTGTVNLAKNMLNRPYSISGIVKEGNKLGRTIGFPTANIKFPQTKTQIPFGVYCASIEVEGQIKKGILNYGLKPTIKEKIKEPLLEVHILNFDKNIYNKPIKINLLKWLREEKKFDSLDKLKIQIEKDLEECLKL